MFFKDPELDYTIAVFDLEKPPMDAQCIRKIKKHSIWHLDWFMRCLDQETIVPWTKKDLWCDKMEDEKVVEERSMKVCLKEYNM